ncbi:MAG: hypothetical protein JSR27_09975 [Proteobacteria bacterium]|nr:hypothetical protein [Pseudomonadota bacterium]
MHNWDSIPYIAIAKSFEQPDPAALQAFTYAELRRVLPAATYDDLAREKGPGAGRGGPYRHAASTDAKVFAEILPIYRIRPVYTGAVYLMYKAGIDIEFATHVLSGVMVAAGLGFLFLMARNFLPLPLRYAPPLLALVFGAMDLARFSTPDGMAFCAWMLCAWLYLCGRRLALLIALPAIIAVRTDLVLFVVPLCLWLFMTERRFWRATALSLAASVVTHFGLLAYYQFPSWEHIFSCSLLTAQRCVHLADAPALGLHDYVAAVARGILGLFADANFVVYLVLVAAAVYLLHQRVKAMSWPGLFARSPTGLIFAGIACAGGRFLLYPAEWDRFFPAVYLLTAFGVLWLIGERMAGVHADPTLTSRARVQVPRSTPGGTVQG